VFCTEVLNIKVCPDIIPC